MISRQHAPTPTATREEPHPTAMIERPGPVLRWFFGRFFRFIPFPEAAEARLRAAAERGTVVYVCRNLSYIDYLYFTFAFLSRGLPLARFANGVQTLFLQPLGRLVAALWRRRREDPVAELANVVREGGSALLFLRRPKTLLGWEAAGFRGAYVEELIQIQRAGPRRPIVFVPLTILWGSPAVRAKGRRRSLVDLVFGEHEAPGRLRQLWMFFTHFTDSQVLVGEPLDLEQFLVEEEPGLTLEVAARRLRWQLGGRLESEVRVVLGPARKGAERIQEEVLKSRRLVAEAQQIGREENIPTAELERRARSSLREIAADPKPWAFALAHNLLQPVWRRIFDGFEIDEAGLERVRQAAHKGPILFVPSHKSHVDYLVLSDICVMRDLVPPHIAAGANLKFFPIGALFRRCGAFFLRRSFRGDRLYAAVFRAYVRKILREGHSVEFFIEGGRSRTGKLLGPKLGLLGMIVEAALEEDSGAARARRAQVVPVSIGYEKVIEEKSYARELAGGAKKKEDVAGLLKATRVLWGQYGQLNIQFDEPFELGAALFEYGAMVGWDEVEGVAIPAGETARRQATQRLAHRIVYGINRVTAVTPTALVAAALLGSGKRGVSRRAFLTRAEFLMARARAVGGRLSAAVVNDRGGLNLDAIDRTLDLLSRDGDLEVRSGSGSLAGREATRPIDEIYTVPDERRPKLAYYRNNALHLYVADALVCLALEGALQKNQLVERIELRARTLTLSRLLKLEFTYRVGETFENIFDQTLGGLVAAGLIVDDGEGVHPAPGAADRVSLLGGQVRDFVESYWVVARALESLSTPVADRDLMKRVQELGEKLFFTGEVRRREACVRANYQNAAAYFRERKMLVEESGKLKLAPGADARAAAAEIAALLPG
jgi:glycerol-3-phosphate O-acyltransferase